MKEQIESGVGVLKIKLGACLSCPTKRMVADLHAAALSCNRVRNCALRVWERWHEDHPGQEKMLDSLIATCKNCGKDTLLPEVEKGGKRVKSACDCGGKLENITMQVYRKCCELEPMLATTIVSSCLQGVFGKKQLKQRVSYRHPGKAKYVWQGILWHELPRPCYRKKTIPVPSQDAALSYAQEQAAKQIDRARMEMLGKSSAVFRFSLLAKASTRSNLSPICRIEVRQKSRGERKLLKAIGRGEVKLRDSMLVWKEFRNGKGAWFLHLVYKQERKQLQLNPAYAATLEPQGQEGTHPFKISSGHAFWKLADPRTYLEQYRRLESRRISLHSEYRVDSSSKRGHGKARFFRPIRPLSRAMRNLMENMVKHVVSEVVKFCVRYDCGKVMYREPGLGLRQHDWFAQHGVPMDWTGFLNRLRHKCWLHGIELEIQRISKKELDKNKEGESNVG